MVKYNLQRKCKNIINNFYKVNRSYNTNTKVNKPTVNNSKVNKPTINKPKVNKSKVNKISFIHNRELIPQVERNLICYNQSWKCNLCKDMFKCSIIIDHIRPLFLGGENNLNNYQGLCDMCNKIKTDVIDKKLFKMYNNNEIKEADLTKDFIINNQIKYYKLKNYKKFI